MASEEILQELVKTAVPLTGVITLSTAHMTQADSELLAHLSLSQRASLNAAQWGEEEWVIDREYGFIVQLTQREKRLETLLKAGISAALYHVLDTVTKDTGIAFVSFDCDERILTTLPVFDW
ncbi:DUF5983 family protein [Rouxiella badensis]|uniref:DUF5983 family protein n=1 Tax=Rouxiella badensis TaxID=1646377 RepID=UPI001D1445E1|nr:DUF5983 family protein [Rouxiella badensis]MCC3742554.1 DUF5983 family protein [Rouxiella badensis]